MRIHRLQLQNFRKFAELDLTLHPQFTLLVGDNGSGKTCILDALAVAIGIWLQNPPDSTLGKSRRVIMASDVRLVAVKRGDRSQFEERTPSSIEAKGDVAGLVNVDWNVRRTGNGVPVTSSPIKELGALEFMIYRAGARQAIDEMYRQDREGEKVLFPIIAYYGAGRAWQPTSKRTQVSNSNGPARRWDAFNECLSAKISVAALQRWFRKELVEKGVSGRFRPGFLAVCSAILNCVPGADDVWFDPDQDEIVLAINGVPQPFHNLSAGQQMMLALAADIAIKCVTQNAYLTVFADGAGSDVTNDRGATTALGPPSGNGTEHSGPHIEHRVLTQTPGVVLIDEIDVHLHPKWQRRVIRDLKYTFPNIQFVATSHSPQVIGELGSDSIVLMRQDGTWEHPHVGTRGALTDDILTFVMGASAQDPKAGRLAKEIDRAVDDEDLARAEELYQQFLEATEEPTVQRSRIRALIENERLLADDKR